MKKRSINNQGQLSVFLIIAVIILIIVGASTYIFVNYFKDSDTTNNNKFSERNQVSAFVESCLKATSEEVFARIGEQGGYYDPVRYGVVPNVVLPTEGPAFEPFPGIVTPYWTYLSSPNNCRSCVHASQQPPLEGTSFPSIQWQASQAIEENVLECINNFEGYEDQFTIVISEPPQVEVTFSPQDVLVELRYPVTATMADGSEINIEDYTSKLDIPLKRMYTVANEIKEYNDDSAYFEKRTINEIAMKAAEDGDPIPPPYGGLEIGLGSGPFWIASLIDPILRELAQKQVSTVQLYTSHGADFISTGSFENDSLYIANYIMTGKDYSDVEADFYYSENWPIYLKVHPSSGQIIKPEQISSGIPLVPSIKRLDFQYDVSYPLLVQLYSKRNVGEYMFQFPIEVNFRNNNPDTFTPITADEEAADLCALENAYGAAVKINTVDQDGNPIVADVRYECISASCPMGESTGGSIIDLLPSCLQATIIAEREGFVPAEVTVDATGQREIEETLTLQQKTTVEIRVAPIGLAKLADQWVPIGDVPVKSNHEMLITISSLEREDSQLVHLPPEEDRPTTMELAPGRYSVTIFALENLDAPKVLLEDEICAGGIAGIGEHCETIPSITLGESSYTDENGVSYEMSATENKVPVGGLQWDEDTKVLDLTYNDIVAGAIILPVFIVDSSQLVKSGDMEAINKFTELSADVSLIPVPLGS